MEIWGAQHFVPGQTKTLFPSNAVGFLEQPQALGRQAAAAREAALLSMLPQPSKPARGPRHLPRGRATALSSPLWGRGSPKRCHPARETSACSVLSQGVSFAPRWEKCPLRVTGPQCCQKLGWGVAAGGLPRVTPRGGAGRPSAPAESPISKHLAFACQGCISSRVCIYNWF